MKKVFGVLALVVIGAGLFGLGWISHGTSGKGSAASPSPGNAPVSNMASQAPATNSPPHAPQPALVSQDEFQKLRAARDAVLPANPDLAKEYKQILSDMQAQQAKFDAALIKADPKVAPVVAKLVALRQLNGAHQPSAVSSPR